MLSVFSILFLIIPGLGNSFADGPHVDTEEARRLLTELGTEFSADYGTYFTVISDAGESSRIRTIADGVFGQVESFAQRLEIKTTRPKMKMTIVYFGTWADYERYGRAAGFAVNENAPGFYDHKSGVCFIYDYADSTLMREKRAALRAATHTIEAASQKGALTDTEREATAKLFERTAQMRAELDRHESLINQTVIRHELAHQSLSHLGIQTSRIMHLRWLCEGLAMQFEPTAGVNASRLADFRAIDWTDEKLSARRLVNDSKLLGPGAEQLSVAYAAAWGMVYYLIHERPKEFAEFIRILRQDAPGEVSVENANRAAFRKCFGEPDAKFQMTWLGYMANLRD